MNGVNLVSHKEKENKGTEENFWTKVEVKGGGRKLKNVEIYDARSATNNIRVINSRWMRWMEHLIHTGEVGNIYRCLMG